MKNFWEQIMSIINDDEIYLLIIAKKLRENLGLYFTIEPVVGNRWTISYADLNVHGEDSDYINEEESRKNGGYKVYDTYPEALKVAVEKICSIGREKYKNEIEKIEVPRIQFPMYDMDTMFPDNTLGVSENDIDHYWDDKKGYCDYEYDEMYESKHGMSPRGDWYSLVLVRDNKIIAFGEEQGNYAGGVYASTDFNYPRFLEEKEYIKSIHPELYEQIKDIPLAEENEYPMYKRR